MKTGDDVDAEIAQRFRDEKNRHDAAVAKRINEAGQLQSRTKLPCDGCGTSSTYPFRAKGFLCRECLDIMREGLAALENQRTKRTGEVVAVTSAPYRMARLPGRSVFRGDSPADLVKRALTAAALAIGKKTGKTGDVRRDTWLFPPADGHYTAWDDDAVLMMPKAAVVAFRDLWKAIKAALEDAYEDGKEDGRNILRGLATGELTPEQFDARTERKGRKP